MVVVGCRAMAAREYVWYAMAGELRRKGGVGERESSFEKYK
jgi:hypothetical protein